MLEDKGVFRHILFVKCFIKGFVGNHGITPFQFNKKNIILYNLTMPNILSIIIEKLKTRYNQTYRMNNQSDSERRKLYMDERFFSDLVATGTIIDAEREVQNFINYHQRTNPYFKVVSINTVSVPIGVTIYVTYED